MREPDKRLTRAIRRDMLCIQMIEEEVKTGTIAEWTGVRETRVRKIYDTYRREFPQAKVRRRRGKTPAKLARVQRSPVLRTELAAAAGLCRALKIIPVAGPDARLQFPSIERGEGLCETLKAYLTLVPESNLTAEALIAASTLLAEGEREVGLCPTCPAAVLFDPLSARARPKPCIHCEAEAKEARDAAKSASAALIISGRRKIHPQSSTA